MGRQPDGNDFQQSTCVNVIVLTGKDSATNTEKNRNCYAWKIQQQFAGVGGLRTLV